MRRTILGVLVVWCVFAYAYAFATGGMAAPGSDFAGYLEGAQRFLDTGTPYTIPAAPLTWDEMLAVMPFVHPPIALYLFVPFLWLPAVVWWLIPLAIFAWCAYRWRPSEWAWVGALVLIGWPPQVQNIQVGNTDMWIAALTGAGIIYGWPAALLVIKPHSLPWALAGVRHRSFWVALGVMAVLAIPLGHLWVEWVTMLTMVESPAIYVVKILPLASVILWAGRTEGGRAWSLGQTSWPRWSPSPPVS